MIANTPGSLVSSPVPQPIPPIDLQGLHETIRVLTSSFPPEKLTGWSRQMMCLSGVQMLMHPDLTPPQMDKHVSALMKHVETAPEEIIPILRPSRLWEFFFRRMSLAGAPIASLIDILSQFAIRQLVPDKFSPLLAVIRSLLTSCDTIVSAKALQYSAIVEEINNRNMRLTIPMETATPIISVQLTSFDSDPMYTKRPARFQTLPCFMSLVSGSALAFSTSKSKASDVVVAWLTPVIEGMITLVVAFRWISPEAPVDERFGVKSIRKDKSYDDNSKGIIRQKFEFGDAFSSCGLSFSGDVVGLCYGGERMAVPGMFPLKSGDVIFIFVSGLLRNRTIHFAVNNTAVPVSMSGAPGDIAVGCSSKSKSAIVQLHGVWQHPGSSFEMPPTTVVKFAQQKSRKESTESIISRVLADRDTPGGSGSSRAIDDDCENEHADGGSAR